MAHFVFRRASSTGARELADALGGSRLKRQENGRFFRRRTGTVPTNVRPGDTIICWGDVIANTVAGVKTLNNKSINSKFTDAETLKRAGISTIDVSRTRPTAQTAPAAPQIDPATQLHSDLTDELDEFLEAPVARNDVYRRAVQELADKLVSFRAVLGTPIPAAPRQAPVADLGWVGRMNDHTGGTDLLTPSVNPDYWVKKLTFAKEYRIHSFLGKSIRAGQKVPREGFATPSSWIRSFDGGWRIKYDDFKSKEAQRNLAAKAVEALGLQFGAVDIGELADGTLVVLEVNRAPGLEGGTVNAYETAIRTWSEGRWDATVAARAANAVNRPSRRAAGQARRAA